MVQVYKFIRWSSVFQHVLLFTAKRNVSVSFISMSIPIFCAKHFLLSTANYKANFGLAVSMYSV